MSVFQENGTSSVKVTVRKIAMRVVGLTLVNVIHVKMKGGVLSVTLYAREITVNSVKEELAYVKNVTMGFGEINVTINALHITVTKHHVEEQMECAVFVKKIIGEIIVTHPAMLRIVLVIFLAVKKLVQDVLNVQQENGVNCVTKCALIIVCMDAKCLTESVTVL